MMGTSEKAKIPKDTYEAYEKDQRAIDRLNEGKAKKEKCPEYIEELKRTCFACGGKHIVCGGFFVSKQEMIEDDKTQIQYIITRYAPMGCFLAHNKDFIDKYYSDKDWHGWKK